MSINTKWLHYNGPACSILWLASMDCTPMCATHSIRNVFIYLCDAILHLRQHRIEYVHIDNTQCLVSVMGPSSVSSHLVRFASSVLFLIEQFLFSIRPTVTMFNLNGIKNEWTHARMCLRCLWNFPVSSSYLASWFLLKNWNANIYTEHWRQPLHRSYLRWEIYSVGQVKWNDGFMCVCAFARTQNTFFSRWRLCFSCVSCSSKILMTPNKIVRTMLASSDIRSLLKLENGHAKMNESQRKNIAWVICITLHFAIAGHPVSGSVICRRRRHIV